jgi:patatin-like phospholipase/acyl hydrolase
MDESSSALIAPFRVLSLDGGGIRGLYTATVLKILSEYFSSLQSGGKPNPDCTKIGKYFNLIVGTSTGGILAVALAAGISLDKVISLYEEAGPYIFPEENCQPEEMKNLPYLLWKLHLLWKFHWLWKFRHRPTANQQPLRHRLAGLFGEKTLADIYAETGIALCLPCVDVTTQKTVVIKTPHLPYLTRDGRRKAVDVCIATSAAPFYFPMAYLPRTDAGGCDIFVDGGLWANNPVVIALIEALELAKEGQSIEIVSVGTCNPPNGETFQPKDCDRGVLDWKLGAAALALSLDAQSFGHNAIAQKLQKHLRVPCRIARLPSTPPSVADAKHFGLDKAYKKALDVLENKAVEDARTMQSLYDNGDQDIQLLASIFSKEMDSSDV